MPLDVTSVAGVVFALVLPFQALADDFVTRDMRTGAVWTTSLPAAAPEGGGTAGSPLDDGEPDRGDFGEDDDVQVDDTTAYPQRTACRLAMRTQNGGMASCSGVLVGPHHVLTAGHCVYQTEMGGWMDEIWVTPAYDQGDVPFATAITERIHLAEGWILYENWLYDMALIGIDRDLGDVAGYLAFEYADDPSIWVDTLAEMNHYSSAPIGDTETMFHSEDLIVHATEYAFGHYLDGAPGSSGAGFYRTVDGEAIVIGVNSWHFASLNNYSTALNAERFGWIEAALAEDPMPEPAPDLLVSGCGLGWAIHELGGDIELELEVRNWGAAEAGDFDVDVYLSTDTSLTHNDEWIGRLTLGGMAPFSSRVDELSIPLPLDASSGDRWLGFIADPDDVIVEVDEANQSHACDGMIVVVPPQSGDPGPGGDVPPEDEGGCRCTAASGGVGGASWVLGLWLLARRRRVGVSPPCGARAPSPPGA
jgi:V8-like Glu-specific endopeptidase